MNSNAEDDCVGQEPQSVVSNTDKTWKTLGDVWSAFKNGGSVVEDDYYQHYTTLSSVITKISQQRWWLTQSTNVRLNDLQEARKFGSENLAKRTYQASFVHSISEDVSMWGLYAPNDPFAIRITIPGKTLKKLLDDLQQKKRLYKKGDKESSDSQTNVELVDIHDILYATVNARVLDADKYDIRRGNHVFWRGVRSEEIKDLSDEIRRREYTGWFKDYEWRHENEARLCMRLEKANGQKAMWAKIPKDVLSDLRFTFSPWLPRCYEREVEKIIRCVYEGAGIQLTDCRQHFRRSSVSGALNLKRESGLEGAGCPLSELVKKLQKNCP